MRGTHIFFLMPAKAELGVTNSAPVAPGPRTRRGGGRRGRKAGLLSVRRSLLTLIGPCRRKWIKTPPGAPGFMRC
jgi:hypothetical protein